MLASSGSGSQVSEDGSRFSFQLNPPLEIPQHAKNITVSAQSATVWWSVPNIIKGVNDTLSIVGPDQSEVVQTYNISLPQGLYDLSQVESAVRLVLENQGAKLVPEPLVSFLADDSTQKVIVRLNYPTVQVFFGSSSPYQILGFAENSTLSRPPTNNRAPFVAQFNQINSFLIHSSLVNQGLRVNNKYSSVIAQVLIDVAPGSQIVSKEFNPPRLEASNLRGKTDRVQFWLTDDKDRAVNTNGEIFTVRVSIRWTE